MQSGRAHRGSRCKTGAAPQRRSNSSARHPRRRRNACASACLARRMFRKSFVAPHGRTARSRGRSKNFDRTNTVFAFGSASEGELRCMAAPRHQGCFNRFSRYKRPRTMGPHIPSARTRRFQVQRCLILRIPLQRHFTAHTLSPIYTGHLLSHFPPAFLVPCSRHVFLHGALHR